MMTSSKLSRRAMVAGASAVPLAAIAATSSAGAAGQSDRRLAEIEARVRELRAAADDPRIVAAFDEGERAFEQWEKQNPMPELPQATLSPDLEDMLCRITSVTVGDLKAIRMAIKLFFEEEDMRAMLDERAKATAKWCKAKEVAFNVRLEKQAPFQQLQDQVYDLCIEASEIRATSVAALQAKARIWRTASEMDDGNFDLSENVMNDLLALRAEAV